MENMMVLGDCDLHSVPGMENTKKDLRSKSKSERGSTFNFGRIIIDDDVYGMALTPFQEHRFELVR